MTHQASALSSKKETKKTKSAKKSKAGQGDFEEKPQDQNRAYRAEKSEGVLIKTADHPHVEPRDFLVSGRVTKRHTRPLTVAEVQQRNRLLVL
jgi:hypothetical protein